MAESRRRLLLIREYFLENTDEQHPVTMPELIAYLGAKGVDADRRAVYEDIALLRECGMDILMRRSRTCDYYLASRPFEFAEVKLLVDAVQASRFLTARKSCALIGKLGSLTSRHQAAQLERSVYVQNRVKAGNERAYYNVDCIHKALQSGRKIAFQYCQYTFSRQLCPRRDGQTYVVSPCLMAYADDNYYLIADHPTHEGFAHYRVDKMIQVRMLNERAAPLDPSFDPAAYARTVFSMFAGERRWVELSFDRALIGAVIDRFGADVPIAPRDETTFAVHAPVCVSPAFFGWLFQFGGGARILGPDDVKEWMLLMAEAARAGCARGERGEKPE